MAEDDDRSAEREAMVHGQIAARGVRDPAVLDAMRRVPRHLFVPSALRRHAYEDRPLALGAQATISQPYIVAFMTELARVEKGSRVLEVGTGSGYQAAVLATLGAEVYTIETDEKLAEAARRALDEAGFASVRARVGDGAEGWTEYAPYDAILVTAAPAAFPAALEAQLGDGGRMVIPVGTGDQRLYVVTRDGETFAREEALAVRFVPLR